MPNHYQVKFAHPVSGALTFGIVDSHSENAKAAAACGHLIIDDAILPVRYEVAEAMVTDIRDQAYPNEFDRHVDAALDAAIEAAKAVQGLQPGALLNCPRGDGYAWYVVTKANKKTAKIEWRGFSHDRWVDRVFQWGGTFPLDILAAFLHHP